MTACFKINWVDGSSGQNFLTSLFLISALAWIFRSENLSVWIFLALATLFLISFDGSGFLALLPKINFSVLTAGTLIWRSILSIKGPERRDWYLEICLSEQRHSFLGSPKKPQGQGLAAATSINRAGKLVEPAALEMLIMPSSKGCLNDSRVERGNSGSSSRNKTPQWAKDISPGCGLLPPPIKPTLEVV